MIAALGLICVILFAACAGDSGSPTIANTVPTGDSGSPTIANTAPPTEEPAPVLRDLTAVDQLKVAFNEDAGQIRLLLILSPT